MKVVFNPRGPGRTGQVAVVGTCCDWSPRPLPGDEIRLQPRGPISFDPRPLPFELELAANPVARFRTIAVKFPRDAWEWEDPEEPIEVVLRRGWTQEVAVEVEPAGPHPKLLPGWRPHMAWLRVQEWPEWRAAREAAGIA